MQMSCCRRDFPVIQSPGDLAPSKASLLGGGLPPVVYHPLLLFERSAGQGMPKGPSSGYEIFGESSRTSKGIGFDRFFPCTSSTEHVPARSNRSTSSSAPQLLLIEYNLINLVAIVLKVCGMSKGSEVKLKFGWMPRKTSARNASKIRHAFYPWTWYQSFTRY